LDYQNLLFANEDGIGVITLNRPKALNALNGQTMLELSHLVDEIAKDETVKVVIITGSGDKAFVAGADITEMQPMTAIEGRNWGKLGQATFAKVQNLQQPVIAAVNGITLGGSLEQSSDFDIQIPSEKSK